MLEGGRGDKLAEMIAGAGKSPAPAPSMPPDGDKPPDDAGAGDPGLDAAQACVDALQGGNAAGFKSALETLIETCYPQLGK